jgi:aminopeptidase N
MIVGSNERRHAWIDEGSTDYLDLQAEKEYWPGVDHERLEARDYLRVAAQGLEQSMMRHGDWYAPGPGYGIASYNKPATLMWMLRDMLGAETWEKAYRTFISEWAYKHPTPWDFFNTFERFAGKDLDWLWTSFYYETWTVDFDAVEVDPRTGGGALVRVVNRGFAPFPVKIRIETTNGGMVEEDVDVEHWLQGNRSVEFELPSSVGAITRVEVDPDAEAPDVDRSNNFWPRGGGGDR